MDITKNKENNRILVLAGFLIIFVLIAFLVRKLITVLNTESPVLDETSKKILNDKKLIENYYEAIEKEKNGEAGNIIVDGEQYKIIRAGKYHSQISTAN